MTIKNELSRILHSKILVGKKQIFTTLLTVLLSVFLVAGIVLAVTTIGTNITTDGTLNVTGNSTLTGDLAVNGGDITTSTTTFNLVNTTATTVNLAGAATTLSIGASTGTSTINNALTVTGILTANGNVNLAFTGTENLAITSDLDGTVDILSIIATPSTTAGTTTGFKITQVDSANTNGLDEMLRLDNIDTDLIVIDGLRITSTGGATMTDAIDVAHTNITNAINVGDNIILGTTAVINFTNFDVATTGGITVAAAQGLDTNAAGILNIGTTNATSVIIGSASLTTLTVTTDGTGTAEVVLPADSIDSTEILDDTIAATDLSDSLCLQVVVVEINPTEVGATDDYINLVDNSFSTTETDENMFMAPIALKIDNLRAEIDVAPGVGNDQWAITIRDDVASTTLTCTIDETATSCIDSVSAVSIAAGSKLAILVDSEEGGGADPAAAAVLTVSFCITQ